MDMILIDNSIHTSEMLVPFLLHYKVDTCIDWVCCCLFLMLCLYMVLLRVSFTLAGT